jgi:hypothetical protein
MTKTKKLGMDVALFRPVVSIKIKLQWSWPLLTRTNGPIDGLLIGSTPPFLWLGWTQNVKR